MNETASAGGAGIVGFIYLAVMILMLVSLWRVFTKAGQPGWACLVPIYNAYILLKIAGKPGWWLVLMFIPLVNLIVAILALVGLANNFGKGGGFVAGLILLPFIFYPILAFGDAQYQGQAA
jgi:hypothetical protein